MKFLAFNIVIFSALGYLFASPHLPIETTNFNNNASVEVHTKPMHSTQPEPTIKQTSFVQKQKPIKNERPLIVNKTQIASAPDEQIIPAYEPSGTDTSSNQNGTSLVTSPPEIEEVGFVNSLSSNTPIDQKLMAPQDRYMELDRLAREMESLAFDKLTR